MVKENQTFELRDNSKRAKIAVTTFWIIIIIAIISIGSNYFQLNLLETVNKGGYVDDLTVEMSDLLQMIVAIIHTSIYIVSVVVFLNWYRRAYGNLHRLKIDYLKTTETMAVWYFFIPILYLYKPYQVVNEIWEETQDQIKKRDTSYIRSGNSLPILLWWIVFISTNIINNFAFRKSLKDETIEDFIGSTYDSLLTDFLMIPEALLVIFIISRISKIETKLFELVNKTETKVSPILLEQ